MPKGEGEVRKVWAAAEKWSEVRTGFKAGGFQERVRGRWNGKI